MVRCSESPDSASQTHGGSRFLSLQGSRVPLVLGQHKDEGLSGNTGTQELTQEQGKEPMGFYRPFEGSILCFPNPGAALQGLHIPCLAKPPGRTSECSLLVSTFLWQKWPCDLLLCDTQTNPCVPMCQSLCTCTGACHKSALINFRFSGKLVLRTCTPFSTGLRALKFAFSLFLVIKIWRTTLTWKRKVTSAGMMAKHVFRDVWWTNLLFRQKTTETEMRIAELGWRRFCTVSRFVQSLRNNRLWFVTNSCS